MTILDEIVKLSIHPFLKSIGFKKKGLEWNRDRGDFVDVITIQASKYNTLERQTFTVNLGVFVKSFYEAVWQQSNSGFAMEADCAVRVRLGDLIQGKPYGDALDQWWEIESSSPDRLIGSEIENALRELGIPFLERFENYEFTANHLQKVEGWQAKNPLNKLYLALAEWKSGTPSIALETLGSIKGKAWEAKADVIHRLIESD